jgi:hypothetical protein
VSNGDVYKLTTLFDYDSNGCGHSTGYEDYPYIYWPNITYSTSYSEISSRTICVKFCPTISTTLGSTDCKTNSIVSDCTTATGTNYDSKLYLKKFCVPDTSSASSSATYQQFYDAVMDDWGGNYLTAYMADLYICWWVLLVCAGCSFLFGFVYMLFIKCCGKLLVWFTVFFGFFVILGFAIFLYFSANNYEDGDSTKDYLTYTAYGMFGLCAIYILALL